MHQSELMPCRQVGAAVWNQEAILVADDDQVFRRAVRAEVERAGRSCLEVSDTRAALCLLEQRGCQTAIVEPNLPGSSWVHFVRELRRRLPTGRVVAVTSFPSRALASEARTLGMEYVPKRACRPGDLFASGPVGSDESPRGPGRISDLHQINWEHVNEVLLRCDGNVSAAARELGISRRGLYYKLRTLPPGR